MTDWYWVRKISQAASSPPAQAVARKSSCHLRFSSKSCTSLTDDALADSMGSCFLITLLTLSRKVSKRKRIRGKALPARLHSRSALDRSSASRSGGKANALLAFALLPQPGQTSELGGSNPWQDGQTELACIPSVYLRD